jgi:DNA replication protein DnaC
MTDAQPRRTEPHRFSIGPTEDMPTTCSGCNADLVREVHPAGTTFGDIERSTPFYCDDCQARLDADEQAELEAEEHKQAEDRQRRVYEAANIPPVFRSATFERCRVDGLPEHAVKAAEGWAQGTDRGLLLVGPVGVGKSTLAAAAVTAKIVRSGRSVHWTTAPELFASLGSGFESPTRDRALELLQSGRPLALDDVDKGRPTGYGAEQIYLAIDQRIVRQAPLLVTSNLGLNDLRERWPEEYGPAIVSRLIGHCELVSMDGSDRRLAQAVAAQDVSE